MKYIQPLEISGKIMTLIKEAEEKLIIVSPYNSIYEWQKLYKVLVDAVQRNIRIEYFIRSNGNNGAEEIMCLGIKPILIKDLHAKLYLNENKAIVSSMNLLLYSDKNSIDLGYETETQLEYDELLKFIDTYLVRKRKQTLRKDQGEISPIISSKNGDSHHFTEQLIKYLKDRFDVQSFKEFTSDNGVYIDNFKIPGVYLELRQFSSYFSIDLRFKRMGHSKAKKIITLLKIKLDELKRKLHPEIIVGNQMYRIHIRLNDITRDNISRQNDNSICSLVELTYNFVENVFEIIDPIIKE